MTEEARVVLRLRRQKEALELVLDFLDKATPDALSIIRDVLGAGQEEGSPRFRPTGVPQSKPPAQPRGEVRSRLIELFREWKGGREFDVGSAYDALVSEGFKFAVSDLKENKRLVGSALRRLAREGRLVVVLEKRGSIPRTYRVVR